MLLFLSTTPWLNISNLVHVNIGTILACVYSGLGARSVVWETQSRDFSECVCFINCFRCFHALCC